MEIPVYIFTGFLESGKTKFIQETLEDERFNNGERTLLLVCEEGLNEYQPESFASQNVYIEVIDEFEQINSKNLTALQKKHKAERVVVEYNGMWPINALYTNVPKSWVVCQEMMFADASTFVNYNSNMRQLMVDKLQGCELVVINRFNKLLDKMEFHKIIRAVSRRTAIAYEYADGNAEYDDIEDPLPFDINAPVIEIKDKDFAEWFRDLSEDLKKYDGKTVKFKGMALISRDMGKNMFLVGRHVMTCCVDDITFKPMICEAKEEIVFKNKQWVTVTAKMIIKKHELYKAEGPVLEMLEAEIAEKPEQEVATFY